MDTDISEISPLFHITRESAVGLKLISANIMGVRGSMLLVHRTRGERFCQFLCSFPTIIFSFKDYLKKSTLLNHFLKTQYVLIKKLKTAPNAEDQFPSHTPPPKSYQHRGRFTVYQVRAAEGHNRGKRKAMLGCQ